MEQTNQTTSKSKNKQHYPQEQQIMAPSIKFLTLLVTMVGFFQGTEGKLYQMNKGCIGNLDLSEKNLQANIDADRGDPSKNQTTVQAAEDWVHKYHWIFTYRQKKDRSEYVNVDESRLTLPQWIEQTNKGKLNFIFDGFICICTILYSIT